MKRAYVPLAMLMLLCACSGPGGSSVGAQVASAVTVGAAITSAEDAVGRTIELAAAKADLTLLRAAYAAELSVNQLRTAYGDSLELTVGELDKVRRDTLQSALRAIGQLESSLNAPLDDMARIEQGLADTIGRLPTVRRHPAVLRWSPLYTVAGKEPLRVTVEGRYLGTGDPYALVAGRRIEPRFVKTDNTLVFEIPEGLVPTKSFEPITLDLRLFHKVRRWLIAHQLQERQFILSVFAAPFTVGTVTLYGSEEVDEISRRSVQTRELGCHAEHCRRCDGSERIQINEPDTYLVVDSPRWNEGYHTDQWGAGIRDVTPSGFTVWWWATSYGCGPFWQGTRGQVRGSVSYEVERRVRTQTETILAENHPITWSRDLRVSTAGRELLTVTAVMDTMLGGSEAVRPGEGGRFFSLEFDRVAGEVLLRPRDLEEVLNRP